KFDVRTRWTKPRPFAHCCELKTKGSPSTSLRAIPCKEEQSMALAELQAVARNDAGILMVLGILKQRLGERFQTGEAIRAQHAHTTTYIPAQLPDGVAFVQSAAEVQDVVRICAAHRVPVIPFGTGTSLEGQVNAPGGGISIDLTGLNRIISVNAEDLDCTVEAGVTREDLNTYLRDTGL